MTSDIDIILAKPEENWKGKIISNGERKFSLTQLEINTLNKLLQKNLHSNKKHQDIISEIEKSINLNISNEINDTRKPEFILNVQELNWLRRFPEEKWVEYLIYRYIFRIYPQKQLLTKFPPYVLIEPTSICNLRCIMCFQVDKSFSNKNYMGRMSWELFTKIVDEVAENECKAITLASRGEPTLHPKFCDMIDYIRSKNILDIKINTNATMLSEKIIKSILKNDVSEVVFSVDAGTKETYEKIRVKGKFEKVVDNIIFFNDIRKNYFPKSKSVTRISGVKVSDNQDIHQMTTFWKQYVDEVSIKPATPRWDSYFNEVNKIDKPCNQLWERIYIWYDGKINPCDFDYKSHLSVGDINSVSIKDAWNSEAYNMLRKKHMLRQRSSCFPCDRCPL